MSWFKLDDQFPNHPKVRRAGTDAFVLFVSGGCYCAQYLTDGMIPKEVVPSLTSLRRPLVAARALVTAGLWVDHDTDYEMHDYLTYNPTREKVMAEREAAANRRRRGGRASADVRATRDGTSEASSPSPTGPDGPEDARSPFEAEFDEVWYFWPKKLDKAHALAQYRARRREGRTQAELMRAVVEFADHAQAIGTEVTFLPYLKTFIGARGQWVEWLDGVPIDAATNEQLGARAWTPEPPSGPTFVADLEQSRSVERVTQVCPLGDEDCTDGYIDRVVDGRKTAVPHECQRAQAATA